MKTRLVTGSRAGFTLIEVLVAITVLGILVVALSTMMVSVMGAVTGGMKHLDTDTAARVALDRIALDVSRMVRRTDVDYYFQKNTTGSDQMAFYSETSGYYPSTLTPNSQGSNVSLVSYRINSSNQLERLSKGLAWNGVSGLPSGANPMVYLPRTICTGSLATWPGILTTGAGSDSDYQVIGDQIFRLEICFLVQNSTTAATLSDQPWLTPDTSVNGMQDVVAVVVGLAVLDSQALKRLSATQVSAAATALSKDNMSTTPPSAPLAVWQAQLNGGATFGLPAYAAAQLRFYQRYCYLGRTN